LYDGRVRSRSTGKERDSESGNDYFEARYYSSAMGRFLSPDWSAKEEPVPYADLDDPQSLNLYAYVRNNPLSKADPDGHCGEDLCVVEGGTALYFAGAAAVAGTAAVLSTPAGQRSLSTFTNAASENFSSNVSALKNTITSWFAKKDAPAPAATGSKENTGPKAATAPGVTAGGQATDEHGNKIGPSGKPQVNETGSKTREGARNKALGEGSGATEHAAPKTGKPHWHPTGADGEKKPTSTHHNYPGN
jgi:RHS repeat-associated protein